MLNKSLEDLLRVESAATKRISCLIVFTNNKGLKPHFRFAQCLPIQGGQEGAQGALLKELRRKMLML